MFRSGSKGSHYPSKATILRLVSFPQDVLTHAFTFSAFRDLAALSSVHRLFNQALNAPGFWSAVLERDFGIIKEKIREAKLDVSGQKTVYMRLARLEENDPDIFKPWYTAFCCLSPPYPPIFCSKLPESGLEQKEENPYKSDIKRRQFYFYEAVRLGNNELVKWLMDEARGELQIKPKTWDLDMAVKRKNASLTHAFLLSDEGRRKIQGLSVSNLKILAKCLMKNGLTSVARDLLKSWGNADENKLLGFRNSLFEDAVRYGHKDFVNELITQGCQPSLKILNIALENDQMHLVQDFKDRKLIDFPEEKTNEEDYGQLLGLAASRGDLDLMQLALAHGADKGRSFYDAAYKAAESGQVNSVAYLEAAGSTGIDLSHSPHIAIAKYYLDKAISPQDFQERFQNLLEGAADRGHVNIIKYLLEEVEAAKNLVPGIDVFYAALDYFQQRSGSYLDRNRADAVIDYLLNKAPEGKRIVISEEMIAEAIEDDLFLDHPLPYVVYLLDRDRLDANKMLSSAIARINEANEIPITHNYQPMIGLDRFYLIKYMQANPKYKDVFLNFLHEGGQLDEVVKKAKDYYEDLDYIKSFLKNPDYLPYLKTQQGNLLYGEEILLFALKKGDLDFAAWLTAPERGDLQVSLFLDPRLLERLEMLFTNYAINPMSLAYLEKILDQELPPNLVNLAAIRMADSLTRDYRYFSLYLPTIIGSAEHSMESSSACEQFLSGFLRQAREERNRLVENPEDGLEP